MAATPKVLLTGRPGIGKTTLIRRFLASVRVQAGGFYTEEIRRGGQRLGFSLNLLSGRRCVLASVEIAGRWRVGKYGVDVRTFESAAVPEIEDAISQNRLIVVDEIGKMELFSERFQEVVRRALDSPAPVLATILSRPHPFADEIRRRRDVTILEVTPANRDRLHLDLARLFGLQEVNPGANLV
jgi:nucleoside-triphosphatase